MSTRHNPDRVAAARHALRVASTYLPKEVQTEIHVLLSATDAEDDSAKQLRKTIVRTLHRWHRGEADGTVFVGYKPGKKSTITMAQGQNQDLRNTLGEIQREDLELVRAAESYFGEDFE